MRVGSISVLDEVEELLGALNVGFVIHHASLGGDFGFVGLAEVVVCHCELILTVCREVVHLHYGNSVIKFDWLLHSTI